MLAAGIGAGIEDAPPIAREATAHYGPAMEPPGPTDADALATLAPSPTRFVRNPPVRGAA